MSLAVVYSRAALGIQAPLVTVETHLSNGLPGISIVGLPEAAVKESKERVRSAVINSQFEFPCRRITLNLAPADLPKEGSRYDLPIALGILAATQQIPLSALNAFEFAGELALSGELRPIQGTLPFALATRGAARALILPDKNAREAGCLEGIQIFPAKHLIEIVHHLTNKTVLTPIGTTAFSEPSILSDQDFSQICGQPQAKRALEIAAAGGHNLLMIGPPGTGKSLLASALPSILPPLSFEEALEVRSIYSLSAQPYPCFTQRKRPFRAPHHTASSAALVGGGCKPKPGEISLAHLGVLFLDELPEFDRKVLEVLREPLESGRILISRAAHKIEFPAHFQLIAAMNPCPCGYLGDPTEHCRCTLEQVKRYQSRLSGPLLDRIDLHIEVPRLPASALLQSSLQTEAPSQIIYHRVMAAFNQQYQRSKTQNSKLTNAELEQHCTLDPPTQTLLQQAMVKFGLSVRSYHRLLRVARTIADLEQGSNITITHMKEALGYRFKGSLKQGVV